MASTELTIHEAQGAIERTPERTFFTNLEQILAQDKIKAMRGEARAFLPIRDQVLVVLCEQDEMSQGGVFIPDTSKERPSEGIVVAVGPGRLDANNVFVRSVVQPGDRVIFGKYSGKDWEIRGRKCRLLIEQQVDGVIR